MTQNTKGNAFLLELVLDTTCKNHIFKNLVEIDFKTSFLYKYNLKKVRQFLERTFFPLTNQS